jgi:hypothetical protein
MFNNLRVLSYLDWRDKVLIVVMVVLQIGSVGWIIHQAYEVSGWFGLVAYAMHRLGLDSWKKIEIHLSRLNRIMRRGVRVRIRVVNGLWEVKS